MKLPTGDLRVDAQVIDLDARGWQVSYDALTGEITITPEPTSAFLKEWARAVVEAHKATEEVHRWQARN